ncbi:probable hexosyltransferase MUCI70 [Aristolochia californica]|uniref:probable hexosyltransferase MUCI70 n=1 Tax=Aristolochia californica TaxID=171875 RepID=UPI0035D5F59B
MPMAFYRHGGELLLEKKDTLWGAGRSQDRNDYGSRFRRGKRFILVIRRKRVFWIFMIALMFFMYSSTFHVKLPFHGSKRGVGPEIQRSSKNKHRKRHVPCEVDLAESVEGLSEPKVFTNFTQFSTQYIIKEKRFYGDDLFEPRFGGHQTLEERENSFYARDQAIHCGFVQGTEESPSTGFDLSEHDKHYMHTCRIVVSSCIFGSSDFLRRPTRKKISQYSQRDVCFVMFVDERTIETLSSEGQVLDDRGYIGLWRIVVVRNLPYADMRKTGKVPKFLSHRLFPSARYSIWIDSKMRLNTDPMLILEYFLWRKGSEYAISNHYDRHCVWEEVLQNKHLNKYNHSAIDEQFQFYQLDGLTKFNFSDVNSPLPSYVPEGSFILRAHTPMSNLFSCLWFNEVDRFTSRDQLSFAYTFLKLRRTNPGKPFFLNMFQDCERRALAKLFHHRIEVPPRPASATL